MSTKIYPIGIQNFEKIRNDGYFYGDQDFDIDELDAEGFSGLEDIADNSEDVRF
jgi:hypothetical protein